MRFARLTSALKRLISQPRKVARNLKKWLKPKAPADPPAPAAKPEQKSPALAAEEKKMPVFDKADLMSRLMDDEKLAKLIIEIFLKDMPLGAVNKIRYQLCHLRRGSMT